MSPGHGSPGYGWQVAVFPLVAAIVAAVFTLLLARQYAGRRRPYQGLWTLALAMYAAASLAMVLGVLDGWSPAEFRVYWLLGAVLNVPFLATGEVYLLARRGPWGHVASGLLAIGTAFAIWKVAEAPIDQAALSNVLPLGLDVFGHHAAYRIAQVYAYPAYVLLLLGLCWSAWQMRGRPELRDRTLGTLLIAAGATVAAIGSGVGAGFHVVPLFSISLAVAVAVMFAGFVVIGRPVRVVARPSGVPSD